MSTRTRVGQRTQPGAAHGKHGARARSTEEDVARDEVLPAASDPTEWLEPEDEAQRLEEGEMEMLLTGHAATHGIEGDDNWMLEPTRHDLD